MTQRVPNWRLVREQIVADWIRDDHSLTNDESFYIGSGTASVLYHGSYVEDLQARWGADIPEQAWLLAHLHRSVLIEALLVQHWILHTLQSQLGTLPYSIKKLNAIKREFAIALEEYHALAFSYGTANDIVKQARKALGTDENYIGAAARSPTWRH